MKKKLLLVVAFFGLIFTSKAQIEFIPSFGYFWGGKVDFYEGRFYMHDNPDYTITASIPTLKGNYFDVSYTFTTSTAEFIPYSSFFNKYEYTTGKLNTNYFLIGSTQQFKTGGKVEPFLGLAIGLSIYDYKYKNTSNIWRFSGGLKAGFKYYISDKIGINVQARLLMPMYFAGIGFYGGMGTGGSSAGLSLNAGALAIQGDVSAGLIYRLK